MLTRAQINRANSLLSTGPKTEAGKKRSAINAIRHGLTSKIVVMPNESVEDYQAHLQNFLDEYHPQGATETQLVHALAEASWRLNRVSSIEATLFLQCEDARTKNTSWDQTNIYTVSHLIVAQSKTLSNLSLHSARLSREFERIVNQLRQLQQARRTEQTEVAEAPQKKRPSAPGFVFTDPPPQPPCTIEKWQPPPKPSTSPQDSCG